MEPGILLLEDGTVWEGISVGAKAQAAGTAVFFTGVVGYQELLTDPASCGIIPVMTYPHIGNCGITDEGMRSERSWCNAMIAKEFSRIASNWQAKESLREFAVNNGIVLLSGVDTQGVAKHLRVHGAQAAVVAAGMTDAAALRVKIVRSQPKLAEVSCAQEKVFSPRAEARLSVVVVDCGLRNDCLAPLLERGCALTVVPWNTPAGEILARRPHGALFSSGPENPNELPELAATAAALLGNLPLWGIGLGSHILACALGGGFSEMKCGHFGLNQAVRHLAAGRCLSTSQAHRFSLAPEFRTPGVEVTHTNLTDGTVEGFRHEKLRVLGTQYYPDPRDAVYDEFVRMLNAQAN